MADKRAIIIGAGPAGLTAAYELLTQTNIKPVVIEASGDIGGISKTVNYKGNRIDIGGHRFFSKSGRVLDWWLNILPLLPEGAPLPARDCDPVKELQVMLVRERLSRILYLRKLFGYPIALNFRTLTNLGFARVVKIAASYAKARLWPIRQEKSLADFFTNRFGKELYATFFRDYTEKVWGVPCDRIRPEWGAQRVKGLSITRALVHAMKNLAGKKDSSVDQAGVETSLIERFMYPAHGPGQLWEKVAERVRELGGEILLHHEAVGIKSEGERVVGVEVCGQGGGEPRFMTGDYIVSTMAVKDLIGAWDKDVPEEVRRVASELPYRDFITVGLLLNRFRLRDNDTAHEMDGLVRDNWIYIQEPDVKVGRLQIFNNWSPYMVKDPGSIWIGLEYFCNEGDDLWEKSDEEFLNFAVREAEQIGIALPTDVLDGVVIRMPKTYPAYFGAYDRFDVVREFTDRFSNLFLVGRNGMHRYNNQDHSMLTAIAAVENIKNNVLTKDNLWAVNADDEYHEEK
ncbi:MAG: NAD(P)/FAD-dependent oxidoreductase [Syntrophobacteraceae bacterium]